MALFVGLHFHFLISYTTIKLTPSENAWRISIVEAYIPSINSRYLCCGRPTSEVVLAFSRRWWRQNILGATQLRAPNRHTRPRLRH